MTDLFTIDGVLSNDRCKALLNGLKDIEKFGISKIVLEFKKENKSLSINSINDFGSIIAKVNFDLCLLDGFTITDDVEYGTHKLSELINLLSIFSSGCRVQFSEKTMMLSHEDNSLRYYASDVNKIKKGPTEDFISEGTLADFTWETKKLEQFVKAISKLEDSPFIIVSGIKDTKSISIAISEKGVIGNSFNTVIPTDTTVDAFKIHITKDFLSQAINGYVAKFNVKINDIAMALYGQTDMYKVEYYIVVAAD